MSGETFWDDAPEPIRSHLNDLAVTADAPSPDEMTHCANCGGSVPVNAPHKVGTCDAPSPDVETVLARVLAYLDAALSPRERDGHYDVGESDDVPLWSDDLYALAAALRGAGLPEPSGDESRTEWGVRDDETGNTVATLNRWNAERWLAELEAPSTLMQRQVTSYPNRVTDWQEATP